MYKINDVEKMALSHALKEAASSADNHYWHRIYCVQLVAQGCSAAAVARWFNNDPSSVGRWVRHFKNFGAEGLRDERLPGRPARITLALRTALMEDLSQSPCQAGECSSPSWTGRSMAVHLEQKYGLKQSLRQCQRLLQQLRSQKAAVLSEDRAP